MADVVSLCLPLSIFSIASKFFNSFKLLITAAWPLCTSTLLPRLPPAHSVLSHSHHCKSALMISVSSSGSFSLCMNYSFTCLSPSLQLYSMAAVLSLPIHTSMLLFYCLTRFQNCSDFIVSLYYGLDFYQVFQTDLLHHCMLLVLLVLRVSNDCRTGLPTQLFYS